MKTPHLPLQVHGRPALSLVLVIGIGVSAGILAVSAQDAAAAARPLQEQLDEQTKRIDRLYRALGPQLEEFERRARDAAQQEREDQALAMERVWVSSAAGLTWRAECPPTEPSFTVVTKDGGIQICDMVGAIQRTLRHPADAIDASLASIPCGRKP